MQRNQAGQQSLQGAWPAAVLQLAQAACIFAVDAWQCEGGDGGSNWRVERSRPGEWINARDAWTSESLDILYGRDKLQDWAASQKCLVQQTAVRVISILSADGCTTVASLPL